MRKSERYILFTVKSRERDSVHFRPLVDSAAVGIGIII